MKYAQLANISYGWNANWPHSLRCFIARYTRTPATHLNTWAGVRVYRASCFISVHSLTFYVLLPRTDVPIIWSQIHDWLPVFAGNTCRRMSGRKSSSAIPWTEASGNVTPNDSTESWVKKLLDQWFNEILNIQVIDQISSTSLGCT